MKKIIFVLTLFGLNYIYSAASREAIINTSKLLEYYTSRVNGEALRKDLINDAAVRGLCSKTGNPVPVIAAA